MARALIAALCLLLTQSIYAESLFNEAGFRVKRFRAPLAKVHPDAITLNAQTLHELLQQTEPPVLIDVQAITVRPESELFGRVWLPSFKRRNIPGSIWLPNIGYPELEPWMQRFLERGLETFAPDPSKPVVFYCVADCWLSWNAIIHAKHLGYSKLYWLAEGSDGWEVAGFELTSAEPIEIDDLIGDGN
ncbi:MAG: PQQ-dependent catabolism-associated CXXCW motif protein [Gammaproteobacteria bacterium]|nr:PQQ-dependent catabolism-associated CXXCW motif protein [Gammaproteobacteria bacterium]